MGSADKAQGEKVVFVLKDNILMRKWSPTSDELDWQAVYQIVVGKLSIVNKSSVWHIRASGLDPWEYSKLIDSYSNISFGPDLNLT